MSHTEETQKPTQTPEANKDPVAEQADELEIVDAMKPVAAPTSNNKPLRYGNRKKKAGESGPTITNLSSVSSFEEEEIEMDDLPIRANAPEDLIDTRKSPNEPSEESDSRPRRQNRSRGERRERKPRQRAPESEAEATSTDSSDQTIENESDPSRPERFGTVKKPDPSSQVQEFRPSRDGRVAPKREARRKPSSDSKVAAPKKKGILSKIISFFTGGEEKEEPAQRNRKSRDGQNRNRGGRGRRAPQGREERDGEGNPNKRRRRRPRNRKPRQGDENGNSPRSQGQDGEGRQGGNNRRRRSRRPRREGQGPREKQESSS